METVAKYIKTEFPDAERVVEVGVGERDEVARILAAKGYKVTVTDVRDVETADKILFVQDDVTEPNLSVYEGADLICSLRPPYELHGPIEDVAQEVGASLVISSLDDEAGSVDADLINYEGDALFVCRR